MNSIEKNRKRAVDVASGMLNGSIDYLEGSIELAALRFNVGVSNDDQDFMVFVAIESEVEHLPIGLQRQYWSREAIKRHETERLQSIEWAKEISISRCHSIIKRFTDHL